MFKRLGVNNNFKWPNYDKNLFEEEEIKRSFKSMVKKDQYKGKKREKKLRSFRNYKKR